MYAYSRDQEPLSQKAEEYASNAVNSKNENLKTSNSYAKIYKPVVSEAIIEIIPAKGETEDKRQAKEQSSHGRNDKRSRAKSAADGRLKQNAGKMFIVNWNNTNKPK